MENWKTTLGGLLISIGFPLSKADDGIISTVGTILVSAGSLLLGGSAVDKKPKPTKSF